MKKYFNPISLIFMILLTVSSSIFAHSPQEFRNKYTGATQEEINRAFGTPIKQENGSWHYKIKVDDYGTVVFHFTKKNGVYVVNEISIFR